MTIRLNCPACGQDIDPAAGLFACRGLGDGREHILAKRLAVADAEALRGEILGAWDGGDPLAAFAPLTAARVVAGPQRHADNAARLQDAMVHSEGRRLAATPLIPAAALAEAIDHRGPLLVKDETAQVAGSHKVRHLAGSLLYLEAVRARRTAPQRPVLAISSCGNAALAAAAVARAAGYELRAFVPDDASPAVLALLAERQARVEIVRRQDTGQGDPCYLAFRRAVSVEGCVPFSCSGRDNWSNIEGGQTLGYETILGWRQAGLTADHLILQVGGGALARATAHALEEFELLGLLPRLPRLHACQTEGAFPFVRAWHLMLRDIARTAGLPYALDYDRAAPAVRALAGLLDFQTHCCEQMQTAAAYAAAAFHTPAVLQVLARAVADPTAFMWPWDGAPPHSLAHGILDDETYDWFFLARALLRTGGLAIAVGESLIARAQALAFAHTAIPVSATGASGLAGLIVLEAAGAIRSEDAVGLFFTGIDR
jgi:threonine synthase